MQPTTPSLSFPRKLPLGGSDLCRSRSLVGCLPRQNSTGGKTRLGRTSRQGNAYIRRLLVIGAQSALFCSKATKANPWIQALLAKRPRLVVAVALVNKMARIAWALMARQTTYRVAAAA